MKEKFIKPNKFGVMNVISAINDMMGSFEDKVLKLSKPVTHPNYAPVYYLRYFGHVTHFSDKFDTSTWRTVHYMNLSDNQMLTILKMIVHGDFDIVAHREREMKKVKVWNGRLGQYVPGHKIYLTDYFFWRDADESRPLIKKLISHVIEHGVLKIKGVESKYKFALEVRWCGIELPKPMMVQWFIGGSDGCLVKTKISGIFCTVNEEGEYDGDIFLTRVDGKNPISVYPKCNVNDIIRLMRSLNIKI